MNYQNIQLFVLIIPASLLLLGIGFIILSLGMGAMQLLVARHSLTHYPDGGLIERFPLLISPLLFTRSCGQL